MPIITDLICQLYDLWEYQLRKVPPHDGGRNLIYVCKKAEAPAYVVRVSLTGDRALEDYLAELEFVRYLAEGGACVADVIPSLNGKLAETFSYNGTQGYISMFRYAKGMLLSENAYRYRDGAPLSEYFYNTGKTLGKIHSLSKQYTPVHRRLDYFSKYNADYICSLLPDRYSALKSAIADRLALFKTLPREPDQYGLVHFDFSDGNYHIDTETGGITVFDFDNCMYCWYMFDLANLWTHGVGWFQFEEDKQKRSLGMQAYFNTILAGYRSETSISEEMLAQLPLFIDMVLIENIVDEFECCKRSGHEVDYEDIRCAAECLIHRIPYAGFC